MESIQSLKDFVSDLISTEKRSKEKSLSAEKKEQLLNEFEYFREQIRRVVEVQVFTNFSQAVQSEDLKIPDVNLHFKDVEIRGDVAQPEIFIKAPVVHLEMSPEDVMARIIELDGMNNTEPGRFIPVEWLENDTVQYDDETGLFITNFLFKVHTDLYKMDPPAEELEDIGELEDFVEPPPEDPAVAEEAALKLEQEAAAKAEEEAKLLREKEESDIRAAEDAKAAEAAKLQEEEAAKAKAAKEAEEKAANHSTSKKKKF